MYKLTQDDGVIRLADDLYIPPDHRFYQDYLAWVAGGGIPTPADEPSPEQIAAEAHQVATAAARGGAKQWFIDNPATLQLFTLTIEELETEVNNLVDALFPAATAQNKTRVKKLWMALAVSIRFLVKRELNGELG